LLRLGEPIELDGYKIKKPHVRLLRTMGPNSGKAQLLVTIHEGRNRQVRRMCSAAGMEVQRLTRVQEGSLRLGTLPSGKWRHLSAQEVQELCK
jgi:23S rRNA pseudouridine2605 synthase